MIEATRGGRAVLCLIDEPFRGTNSGERVAAAAAITTALVEGGGVHLIATHDEALAAMEFDGKAANYHFGESFEQNRMVFDYQLRPGPARGRNALKVLEAEGYPPDIVAQARRRWEAMSATDPTRRPEGPSPPPR
jgi:DNA mismatch repair ATPase MutS